MAIPTTTMRLDERTKQEAKVILEELGFNLSSATNLFLKAVVRSRGIPFDLRLGDDPAPVSPADIPTKPDFIAEYLFPWASPRNEIHAVGQSPDRVRQRLMKRNSLINEVRRTVE